MQNNSKSISIPLIIGGLILVIVIGGGGIFFSLVSNNKTNVNSTTNNTNTTSTTTSTTLIPNMGSTMMPSQTTNSMMTGYKDGSYNVSQNFFTPGGVNSINLTLVVTNGAITSVKTNTTTSDFESQRYDSRFNQGISSAVVGKAIDKAYVGRINGASLTSSAFNSALDKIIKEAKV